MSSELSILAIYGVLVLVVILVQTVLAIPQLGLAYMATPRDEARPLSGVAARAERATNNCTIALAAFGAAILVLAAKDAFTPTTLMLAQVFLIARIVYVIVYLLGVPWIRTGAFVLAMICNLLLLFMAI